MLTKILTLLGFASEEQKQTDYYRSLIRQEAQIGAQVFGAVPPGHRREFFCLDEHTWIWHEEWLDETGQRQVRTTRYDVRPDGILKAQNNGPYHKINADEARNLYDAAKIYIQRAKTELYADVSA